MHSDQLQMLPAIFSFSKDITCSFLCLKIYIHKCFFFFWLFALKTNQSCSSYERQISTSKLRHFSQQTTTTNERRLKNKKTRIVISPRFLRVTEHFIAHFLRLELKIFALAITQNTQNAENAWFQVVDTSYTAVQKFQVTQKIHRKLGL